MSFAIDSFKEYIEDNYDSMSSSQKSTFKKAYSDDKTQSIGEILEGLSDDEVMSAKRHIQRFT
jgi:hypothetical protein